MHPRKKNRRKIEKSILRNDARKSNLFQLASNAIHTAGSFAEGCVGKSTCKREGERGEKGGRGGEGVDKKAERRGGQKMKQGRILLWFHSNTVFMCSSNGLAKCFLPIPERMNEKFGGLRDRKWCMQSFKVCFFSKQQTNDGLVRLWSFVASH